MAVSLRFNATSATRAAMRCSKPARSLKPVRFVVRATPLKEIQEVCRVIVGSSVVDGCGCQAEQPWLVHRLGRILEILLSSPAVH